MSINCNKITKGTKDLMLSLTVKTGDVNREHYIKLCEDKNGNITNSYGICRGLEYASAKETCEIKAIKCPPDTIPISEFHTHPWVKVAQDITSRPSMEDIISSVEKGYKSFCLGHITFDYYNVDCYDIKDKILLELGNSERKLIQMGEREKAAKEKNLMFDRIDSMGYPNLNKILNKKCTFRQV